MSDSADEGEGVDADPPDAVLEWLNAVAAERGLSETELLRSLLAGEGGPSGGGGRPDEGVDPKDLERVEREFREHVEDVRERIVQVKRETDGKAPADHTHHELESRLEQLGQEIGTLEGAVNRLDERLSAGFENYEEILTYLTETTESLDRKLGRLASAVIDLRERVGDAARAEVRRTALAHLTDTANRHGVEKARCDDCGEIVHVGMLVAPECPHCDSSFSGLEPKRGFFRSSVLHTGTRPALEAGAEVGEDGAASLEAMVEDAASGGEAPTTFDPTESTEKSEPAAESATTASERAGAEPAEAEDTAAGNGGDGDAVAVGEADVDPKTDGQEALKEIDGIGPAYADRLQDAGIDDLASLAVADPEELGKAIDVPSTTVAEWVEQAAAMAGT